VTILKRNHDSFGRDIEEMIAKKMTFEEGLRNGGFSIMAKQRLKIVRDGLFEQLDALDLGGVQKNPAAPPAPMQGKTALASWSDSRVYAPWVRHLVRRRLVPELASKIPLD
jgi:hypothetical protein